MLVFFTNPVPDDLKKIRGLYPVMSSKEEVVDEIKTLCTKTAIVSKPLASAYLAAAEMASAEFKINPISKLSAFNSGKKMLEAAVNADSNNVEIRYIRYTIQSNAPSFLGYTKNKTADKNFLLNHLNIIRKNDPELFSIVYAYLLNNGDLKLQQGSR